MKVRKCMIVITVSVLLGLSLCCGCKENISDTQTESTTDEKVVDDVAKIINNAVDENYNSQMTKTELWIVPNNSQTQEQGRKGLYVGRHIIYIGNLLEKDNIASVEYTLSNCVGTFMDSTYEPDVVNGKVSYKDAVVNMKNNAYVHKGVDQSNVFFTVYYYYYEDQEIEQRTQQVRKCYEEARITANITYNDGSTETKYYGIGHTANEGISQSNIAFYKLEYKDAK